MVFYRKYRSQTLDELLGQESVKQTLKSAITSDKLAHAYLFCGPRGTGKTSTARILAKMVNCEKLSESLPCNQCPNCVSITDGSNMDVVEMDAASNRGIEDIRNLRDNIKLSPSAAKKKVYIIDEVHMLSNDAFNALLKTLEEPPTHVLFILATTEAQKIPQTILSRVQRLDFKPATIEDLVTALGDIAQKEKIEIQKDALLALAGKAGGSFRDGIKLLDQLSAHGKIDLKIIEEHLGVAVFSEIVSLLESIVGNQAGEALQKLTQQIKNGSAVKEFNLSLLDTLRLILFIKNDLGEVLVKPEIGEEKYQLLKSLAGRFTLDRLLHVLSCFQQSLEQGRFASIPTLPLEIAVVESCESSFHLPGVSNSSPDHLEGVSKPENQKTRESENTDVPKHQLTETPVLSGSDIKKIHDRWGYVLETVKQFNFSLEALLRLVKISECNESNIVIEVPYAFHQRILEAPKNRDLMESVLSDILGRSVKVSTSLAQKSIKREEIANVEIAADDEIVRIASEIFNS